MSNQNQRLRDLYQRFLTNDLSAMELDEFLQMMSRAMPDGPINGLMDGTWSEIYLQKHPTPVVSIARKNHVRLIVSAASVVLVFFVSGYFLLRDKVTMSPSVSRSEHNTVKAEARDRAPGRQEATLTLANGTKLVLGNTQTGTVASQGGTRIIKLSAGQLSYAASTGDGTARLYNTLSTPRGGQYQVALPDGSQVWMNASSSLHFPTSFSGSQRMVDLTGEAYFEVAANKEMPFIVRVNGSQVTVLGTHFNVNGYADEPVIKTTLLEGSVAISKGTARGLLVPGQQAQVAQSGQRLQIAFADVDEAMAWKNGFFQFDKSDIESVMKQVSRWYDLDVRYEGRKPTGHFRGRIKRSVYLSEMLKVIEASGVHFKLEGKTLIVMS